MENGRDSGTSPLARIIQASLKKEMSILQVAQSKTGIITVDEDDRRWIEQLSRACLQNQKTYFLQRDTSLAFDYLYIQSYIIRTHLLFCRVNAEHLRGQYRCLNKQIQATTTSAPAVSIRRFSDQPLDEDWSHLQQMSFDRLKTELDFLQRIQSIVDHGQDEGISRMRLSEFVRMGTHDSRLADQYEEYHMKDFALQQIHAVCQLYTKAINASQHMFIGVSQEIMEPLTPRLSEELYKNFDNFMRVSVENDDKTVLDQGIQIISEFIDDLRGENRTFAAQSTLSFRAICEALSFQKECYELIPEEIQGKNYGPVWKEFVDLRSHLYERKISIREKTTELWSPFTDRSNPNAPRANDFARLRPTSDEDVPEDDSNESEVVTLENNRNVLGEYKINPMVLETTVLLETIRKRIEDGKKELEKLHILHFLDKTWKKGLSKPTNLYGKLRELFTSKNYDLDRLTIVDSDGVNTDFHHSEALPSIKPTKNEYYVIETAELITVNFEFEDISGGYSVTREAQLSAIVPHFIEMMRTETEKSIGDFHLFDSRGRLLTKDCSINDLHPSNQEASLDFVLIPFSHDQNSLIDVVFTSGFGK